MEGVVQSRSDPAARLVVRISPRGPSAEAFGWEIYREVDSVEIRRSTRVFPTRLEALLDSVRTGIELNAPLIVEPSELRCGSVEPVPATSGSDGQAKS